MREENRRYARIGFHLPVEIEDCPGAHKICELSMGGVFVETAAASEFKIGDEIDILVRRREKEPIQATCRVTRVTDRGIGIEFVHITLQDAWELIMETEWRPNAETDSRS